MLEPALLAESVAGAPRVLAATLEGGGAGTAAITLRWIAADGSSGSELAVTDAAGVALFAVTVPAGDVEFTAWADELDSNSIRLTGM